MRCILETLLICLITTALLIGGCFYLSAAEPAPDLSHGIVETLPYAQAEPFTTLASTEPERKAEDTTPESIPESIPETPISSIPKYYQTDYPHYHFGNGTIATSGCSITCLAMVSSYLTDQAYFPDQMAYHFGNYGKNNIERLEYGCSQMRLPYEKTDNVMDVLAALEDGKIAIVMMGEASVFTSEQHFIVLAGMTEDEKIIVHDPLEVMHSSEVYMQNGFQSGFGAHDIMRGFSGGWIFDKEWIPEDHVPFDAAIPQEDSGRYAGLTLTDEEHYLLVSFLWAEAREQPLEVQRAIAEVILNRVFSDKFPNTVRNVLYKGEYYSVVERTKYAEVETNQYIALDMALNGPYLLPMDVLYFSIWDTRGEAWGTIGPYTFIYSR